MNRTMSEKQAWIRPQRRRTYRRRKESGRARVVRAVLVKITRVHCQPSEQRAVVYQLAGNQVNDLALAFHYTMHGEKL